MKKTSVKSILCATIVVALSSCSDGLNKKISTTVDAASIAANATLSNAEKAEKLAKASEQLLTGQGFSYASDVADLALQKDSTNVRAQFVKAIIGPIMAYKGIYRRVKPLADLDKQSSVKYTQAIAKFEAEVPNSTIKEFLLDGSEDLRNESDVQNYLDSVADSFKAIRLFSKANMNSELTFMASDTLFATMQKRYSEACKIRELGKYSYEMDCPSSKNFMQLKMNRADFIAIQHIAAGFELYYSLLNSYNLTGSIEKALSSQGQYQNAKTVLEDLLENKEFATIRDGNGFRKVKEMGLDAIAGVRWVMQNQNSLCPMGKMSAQNRIGMLISQGLCSDKSTTAEQNSKNISQAQDLLSGKVFDNVSVQKKQINGAAVEEYKTSVRPLALFETPVADLRALIPTTHDNCGNGTAIQDNTVSGLLINGDFNKILEIQTHCGSK